MPSNQRLWGTHPKRNQIAFVGSWPEGKIHRMNQEAQRETCSRILAPGSLRICGGDWERQSLAVLWSVSSVLLWEEEEWSETKADCLRSTFKGENGHGGIALAFV